MRCLLCCNQTPWYLPPLTVYTVNYLALSCLLLQRTDEGGDYVLTNKRKSREQSPKKHGITSNIDLISLCTFRVLSAIVGGLVASAYTIDSKGSGGSRLKITGGKARPILCPLPPRSCKAHPAAKPVAESSLLTLTSTSACRTCKL